MSRSARSPFARSSVARGLAPVAALLLVVGLASPTHAGSAPAGPVPAGAKAAPVQPVLPAFYTPPSPLPAGAPGKLIRSEAINAPELHGTAYRVMYHSRSIKGADIAVTGYIAVPSGPAPAGGHPVVAWAHGTTGIADQCAPSLDDTDAVGFNALLDQGWVVAATDYEGLGTPGRHPYIVGDSEARGVIDSVRAARDLPAANASTHYVVWGHSQGGHAAMFSLHIADAWAPELDLRGVVAGAPPSQLNLVYDFLVTSPYRYYLLMVGAAINAAYGDTDAPLTDILNAKGLEKVKLVDQGCTGFLGDQTEGVSVQDLMLKQADGTYNPYSNPTWGPLIKAQDPQNFATPAKERLLIIHGGADEQIPTVSSELLAGQLCATGQQVSRWVFDDQSHAGVIGRSFDDMVGWISNRFGEPGAPASEWPAQLNDVDASVCADGVMQSAVPGPDEFDTTTVPDTVAPELQEDPVVPAPPAYAVPGSANYTG